MDLVQTTGLTRNAVLVSLNELLRQGVVVKDAGANTFSLGDTSATS